jgi:hypothetical protein
VLFLLPSLAAAGEFLEGGQGAWKEATVGPVFSPVVETQRKDGVEAGLLRGLFRGLFLPLVQALVCQKRDGWWPSVS